MTTATMSVPVNTLYPDRYQVGRTKLYEYLKTLEITPFKPDGDKRGHITLEQLQDLDVYVDMLGKNGPERAQEFAQKRLRELAQLPAAQPVNASVNVSATPIALPPAMEMLVDAIAQRLQPEPSPDIFAPQRQLEEAWENQWTIQSRQLKAILGAAPTHGAQRYGFELRRVARGWWRVDKALLR